MSEQINKNAPVIRFKGFEGDWEKKTLDDVATIFDGTHQTPKYTDSGVRFVSVENIKNLETNKFISEEDFEKDYGNKKPKKGDVLMTRIGDIGTTNIVKDDFPLAYYVTLALLKPENINSNFLSWVISSPNVQSDIWKRTLHIAFPKKINLSEINKVELFAPEIKEQKRIGSFFKQLDTNLTQHQTQLEKLKNLKQAMLYKMFPQNGATEPEIRFKGFTGEWKFKPLGEIATIKTGSSNREDSILDGKYTFFDRSEDIRTSNIYLFDCEAIIVAGEGQDFVPKYFKGKFDLHQRTYAIMDFINASGGYLFYAVYLFRDHLYKSAVGSTVKSLRLPMFKEMILPLPEIEEQQKIGNYFRKLDQLITLQTTQLKKLQQIKQACLTGMFV